MREGRLANSLGAAANLTFLLSMYAGSSCYVRLFVCMYYGHWTVASSSLTA